jgi:hypothetical protein
MDYLTSLFQETGCVEIEEPEGTPELWLQLADAESTSPKVWMDAYLAAVLPCARRLGWLLPGSGAHTPGNP